MKLERPDANVYSNKRARYIVPLHALFFLLGIGILLAAFGLRVWHLDTQSIWHDEAWSIRAIRDPITTPDDNTPFVYYLLMRPLWMGAGESAFALRYGSALLGLLVAAMTLRLGGRWYGRGVGLAAGALAAVSPLLWAYSQEVRAYILVPLLALVLLEYGQKIARSGVGAQHAVPLRDAWKYWVIVATVEVVALYTHNLAVPLVAWLNGALLAVWLVRWEWRRAALWLGLQAAVGLLYVPWLLTQTPSGTPLNTPPTLGLGLVRDIWYSYFLPVLPQLRGAGVVMALDALGVALIVGLVALISSEFRVPSSKISTSVTAKQAFSYSTRLKQSEKTWLLVSQVVGVPLLTTGLLIAAHIDFHPRYYIASVPGTLIALAAGVQALSAAFKARGQWLLTVGLCLVVGGLSLGRIGEVVGERAYQHDDFAGVAAYYATLPEDAAILLPFGTEPALQTYFAERLGIRAQFLNLPLYSDETAAVAAINSLYESGVRQVEFLTWYQLPADERGMYPCLLAASSSGVGEPRSFFGLMTQGYRLAGNIEMQPLTATPRYADFVLQDAAYAASAEAICIRTRWEGDTTPHGLSVAASTLNPLGDEIARADAAAAPADPASAAVGAAYSLLRLPEGAPRLDYDLALTLYSPEQPTGYDLLSVDGNPAGKVYRLPGAITAQGAAYAGEPVTRPVLQGDNTGDGRAVDSGTALDITLLLPGRAGEVGLVTLTGADWQLEAPLVYGDLPLLSWHRFEIAPGNGGEAVLSADGLELARYTISDPQRVFEPPPFDIPLNVAFPGIGALVGATVGDPQAGAPLAVTLVWRANATPETAYTVFVQLVGADGGVLAQSDLMPAGNTRPTTGWLAGEYITDTHTLNVPAFEGEARLIAGLYDGGAAGFPRARTSGGADFVEIEPP